ALCGSSTGTGYDACCVRRGAAYRRLETLRSASGNDRLRSGPGLARPDRTAVRLCGLAGAGRERLECHDCTADAGQSLGIGALGRTGGEVGATDESAAGTLPGLSDSGHELRPDAGADGGLSRLSAEML